MFQHPIIIIKHLNQVSKSHTVKNVMIIIIKVFNLKICIILNGSQFKLTNFI